MSKESHYFEEGTKISPRNWFLQVKVCLFFLLDELSEREFVLCQMYEQRTHHFSRPTQVIHFFIEHIKLILQLFSSLEPINHWHIYVKEQHSDWLLDLFRWTVRHFIKLFEILKNLIKSIKHHFAIRKRLQPVAQL